MSYQFSADEIAKEVGLKKSYVLQCVKDLKEKFQGHVVSRGHNKKYFNSNAYKIFEQIKKLRDEGKTMGEIKELFGVREDSIDSRTGVNSVSSDQITRFVEQITDLQKTLNKSKDEASGLKDRLMEKDRELGQFKNQILLLTDGRDVAEVKEEQRKREQRIGELNEKLKNLQKENKKIKLSNEMGSIKWFHFKGKRKKELKRELEDLEKESD